MFNPLASKIHLPHALLLTPYSKPAALGASYTVPMFFQSPPLDALLNAPDLKGAVVCAIVMDASGKELYAHNASLEVSPASNEKLFSAAFALYELGPSYVPVTSFWKLGDRIVVESNGDPAMSYAQLSAAGATLNPGKTLPVYVKQAYDPEIPGGWEVGDLPNRYAAPVSAFSVDQGGFTLWNNAGNLELRPANYGVRIDYRRSTGKGVSYYDPIKRSVVASGTYEAKGGEVDTLAVPNGAEAAASLVGTGFTPTTEVPSSPPTLQIKGPALSEILTRCLQHSDNIMAENLLLMGASHQRPLDLTHPYPQALKAIAEFETRVVGLPAGELAPQDGSGLTSSNLVTVSAVASLLNWAQRQPTALVWRSALASAGGVGTLSRRLKGVDFHGKTGSLNHVAALSGYLVDKHAHAYTLSVILNNFTCSEGKARAAIDRFVTYISDNGL